MKTRWFLVVLLTASSAILLLIVYGMLIERTHLKVETVRITSPKLNSTSENLTLVHLSDPHLSKWTAYQQRIVDTVNSIQPDAIVITGDFFKSREWFERPESEEFQQELDTIVHFLSQLHAPLGIYLCRGNNDFGNDKEVSDLLPEAVRPLGVKALTNETVKLPGPTNIYLLGVDFPEFPSQQVADFVLAADGENTCLQAYASTKNSYSHVWIQNHRSEWQNYTVTGRFRSSNPDSSGIGITFYSQFDRGYDRFYRLRRRAGTTRFRLSPHGAPIPQGNTEFECPMLPQVWYRFKVECRTEALGTRMRAKVWQTSLPEPQRWQADALDASATFQSGTVGLWSHGQGHQQFDDLTVQTSAGDTLFYEDFEVPNTLQQPPGWIDYDHEFQAIPHLMSPVPDSAFSILLAHTPDAVTFAEAGGVDLQLSGHTHGGQLCIPGWGPPIVRIELGRRYTQGLFRFGDTQLYVNRGLGSVLLPLRLFCRPEITIIRLEGE